MTQTFGITFAMLSMQRHVGARVLFLRTSSLFLPFAPDPDWAVLRLCFDDDALLEVFPKPKQNLPNNSKPTSIVNINEPTRIVNIFNIGLFTSQLQTAGTVLLI